MHVIMKIRVPVLRIDAGYVLMGTVGKQMLRGNGLLSANFSKINSTFDTSNCCFSSQRNDKYL